VPLIRKAFDPKNGPLTDHNQTESEKEALCHLFAGTRSTAAGNAATHLLSIVGARG
jgi:hypothetical protein